MSYLESKSGRFSCTVLLLYRQGSLRPSASALRSVPLGRVAFNHGQGSPRRDSELANRSKRKQSAVRSAVFLQRGFPSPRRATRPTSSRARGSRDTADCRLRYRRFYTSLDSRVHRFPYLRTLCAGPPLFATIDRVSGNARRLLARARPRRGLIKNYKLGELWQPFLLPTAGRLSTRHG